MTDKKNPALNNICMLIGRNFISDAVGNQVPQETQDEVFCGEIAITEKEFYDAAQSGIRPETAIIVNSMDYDGQEKVSFQGIVYSVLRRYPRVDEFTELYLQRK
ncbi:phage head-tail adapter protein [Anaerotignum sp.]|nr:phage head-tail adapter protein [Anaerotignum sp.]MCI5680174.1 hypothetical protein [Bacteroidales bacterium]MDY3926864.1 phage head-tail adapter protein [Anaerotignum sp.]